MKLSNEQMPFEIFVGNKGTPNLVILNDLPHKFSYNETTSIVNFDLVHSGVNKIKVTFGGDTKPPTSSDATYSTTVAGNSCTFSCKWRDDVGLGGFIFSTNNSGVWVNSTWVPLTGKSAWANTTQTLNNTVGTVVCFRWYCNDTDNNWNIT